MFNQYAQYTPQTALSQFRAAQNHTANLQTNALQQQLAQQEIDAGQIKGLQAAVAAAAPYIEANQPVPEALRAQLSQGFPTPYTDSEEDRQGLSGLLKAMQPPTQYGTSLTPVDTDGDGRPDSYVQASETGEIKTHGDISPPDERSPKPTLKKYDSDGDGVDDAWLSVDGTAGTPVTVGGQPARVGKPSSLVTVNGPQSTINDLVGAEPPSGYMWMQDNGKPVFGESGQPQLMPIPGGPADKDGKPTQSQDTTLRQLEQEYDRNIEAVTEMIAKVEEDPTLVGLAGSVRKAGQTIIGSAEDIASVFGDVPVLGRIYEAAMDDSELSDDQKASFFDDPNLSQLRLYENTLGYALARTRQPTGRLMKDTIDRALSDAKLTGFTSSRDVVYRMKEILNLLKREKQSIAATRGKTERRRYNPETGSIEVYYE